MGCGHVGCTVTLATHDVTTATSDNMSGNLGVPQFPAPSSAQRVGGGRNKVALKPGRSLMDWIRLSKSRDLSGTGGRLQTVTPEELAKHDTVSDAWTAIRGKVYNVTAYAEYHPGGAEELMRAAGRDGTDLFNEVHRWVNYESMLESCLVGRLKTTLHFTGTPKRKPPKVQTGFLKPPLPANLTLPKPPSAASEEKLKENSDGRPVTSVTPSELQKLENTGGRPVSSADTVDNPWPANPEPSKPPLPNAESVQETEVPTDNSDTVDSPGIPVLTVDNPVVPVPTFARESMQDTDTCDIIREPFSQPAVPTDNTDTVDSPGVPELTVESPFLPVLTVARESVQDTGLPIDKSGTVDSPGVPVLTVDNPVVPVPTFARESMQDTDACDVIREPFSQPAEPTNKSDTVDSPGVPVLTVDNPVLPVPTFARESMQDTDACDIIREPFSQPAVPTDKSDTVDSSGVPVLTVESPVLPVPTFARESVPRYDWFQSDKHVTVVVYTKRKGLTRENVILDKTGREFELRLFLGQQQMYQVHVELEEEVTDEFNVTFGASGSKLDVKLTKVTAGRKWRRLGSPLEQDGRLVCTEDCEQRYRACVVESRAEVTYDTTLYRVRLPPGSRMWVPAGYHVYVRSVVSGYGQVSRPYTPVPASLSSTPAQVDSQGTGLYLMIKVYPQGVLTPVLAELRPGDHLDISDYDSTLALPPLDDKTSIAFLVAGTGFTPVPGLATQLLSDQKFDKVKITIFFFNKQARDILWREQLEKLEQRYAQRLKVIHVLSDPGSEWSGRSGRVRSEVVEGDLPAPGPVTMAMVCGPVAFNQAAVKVLREMGYQQDMYYVF